MSMHNTLPYYELGINLVGGGGKILCIDTFVTPCIDYTFC